MKGDILGFNMLKPMLSIIHIANSEIAEDKLESLKKAVQRYIDTQAQVRMKIFLDENLEELEKRARAHKD